MGCQAAGHLPESLRLLYDRDPGRLTWSNSFSERHPTISASDGDRGSPSRKLYKYSEAPPPVREQRQASLRVRSQCPSADRPREGEFAGSEEAMGALSRPEEVVALVKLRVAAGQITRQIPSEEHWAFCYSMLQKVSRSFALVIQQLGPQLRNAVSTAAPAPIRSPGLLGSEARRIGLLVRFLSSLLWWFLTARCCPSRRCASSTSCSAPSTP
jgi:hypothetical protein